MRQRSIHLISALRDQSTSFFSRLPSLWFFSLALCRLLVNQPNHSPLPRAFLRPLLHLNPVEDLMHSLKFCLLGEFPLSTIVQDTPNVLTCPYTRSKLSPLWRLVPRNRHEVGAEGEAPVKTGVITWALACLCNSFVTSSSAQA